MTDAATDERTTRRRWFRVVVAAALAWTTPLAVTTGVQAADLPASPTNVTATVTGNSVHLTWTDNATDELSYDIYRADLSAGRTTFGLVGVVAPDTTVFTDTVLAGAYLYRVRAYNGVGISPVTPAVTAYVDFPPPPAPTDVTATKVGNDLVVSWTDNATDEDYDWVVLRTRPIGTSTWTALGHVVRTPGTVNLGPAPDPLTTQFSVTVQSAYTLRKSAPVRAVVTPPLAVAITDFEVNDCATPAVRCTIDVSYEDVRMPFMPYAIRYRSRATTSDPWSAWVVVPGRFIDPTTTIDVPGPGWYQVAGNEYAFDGLTPTRWWASRARQI